MISTIGRLSVGVVVVLLAGCGLGPNPKLGSYVGVHEQPVPDSFLGGYSADHRLPVGLLVVNDTTEEKSAPPMTQESIAALTQQLSHQIQDRYPLQVVQVIKNAQFKPGPSPGFSQLGKEAGVDYLVVAILSSHEVEAPDRLPLQGVNQGGGGRGWLLGYRAENFSLAEIAVVDVQKDQSLFQASGRGYATLDRLAVPLESNIYPVVQRAQRWAPIYPEEQSAHDVLRTVSAQDAIDQALFHLKLVQKRPAVS